MIYENEQHSNYTPYSLEHTQISLTLPLRTLATHTHTFAMALPLWLCFWIWLLLLLFLPLSNTKILVWNEKNQKKYSKPNASNQASNASLCSKWLTNYSEEWQVFGFEPKMTIFKILQETLQFMVTSIKRYCYKILVATSCIFMYTFGTTYLDFSTEKWVASPRKWFNLSL